MTSPASNSIHLFWRIELAAGDPAASPANELLQEAFAGVPVVLRVELDHDIISDSRFRPLHMKVRAAYPTARYRRRHVQVALTYQPPSCRLERGLNCLQTLTNSTRRMRL